MAAASARGRSTTSYNRLVTVAILFGSLVSIIEEMHLRGFMKALRPGITEEPHADLQWTYGYSSSIIGSTIGQPGWCRSFNLPLQGEHGYGGPTTHAIATANGLYSAGGAIGCLFIMWSATALGRKRSIQIGALLAMFGGALQGGAANLE